MYILLIILLRFEDNIFCVNVVLRILNPKSIKCYFILLTFIKDT